MLISSGVFNPAVVSLRLERWREEERKLPMEWGAGHLGCLAKVRIIENRSGTGIFNLELKVRIRNKVAALLVYVPEACCPLCGISISV